MGRNRTGPPWSVGRPTTHAPGLAAADHRRALQPAALQTTTTDVSEQNNTGPLGRPVIMHNFQTGLTICYWHHFHNPVRPT